jgi:hypothetical protein
MIVGWLGAPNLAPPVLAAFGWAISALAAAAVGLAVWRKLGYAHADDGAAFLAAIGLGHVLLAYVILALGILGILSPLPLLATAVLFLLLGLRSALDVVAAFRRAVVRSVGVLRRSRYRLLYAAAAPWLILTFLGALGPSDARDWDGLSEHLAQAKTYVRLGKVQPLWYDHHSHFPATMVMLYCQGLVMGGQGAAKLFHWSFAVLSLLAVQHLARRHLDKAAGGPAMWVLMTTPLFGWLATVGYVDLANVFFCLMATDYLLAWREGGNATDLARAGLMAGCGMTVKMQALFTWAVLLLAAGFWTWRLRRSVRPLLIYAGVAIALAAPWYVKSWVVTGNPVYPFAFGLFGGKHWSATQARSYAYHHASFGYGRLPPEEQWQQLSLLKKRTSGSRHPLMMLIAPFTLTFLPEYYAPRHPRLTAMVMLSVGPMYLALVPVLLALPRRKPVSARRLALLFAIFWLLWLETTQLERYLLPWLALTAPLAGLSLAWLLETRRLISVAIQTLVVVWSLVALLFLSWQLLPMLPVNFGLLDARAYLGLNLDCYQAEAYLNQRTPPDALVASYGEPRLFYLDRDYLWADPGHSLLIDYEHTQTPQKLLAEYHRLGIDYLLINQRFFGQVTKQRGGLHRLLAEALEGGMIVPLTAFERGSILVLRVASP